MKTTFKTAAVFFCSVFAIFLSSCGSTPEAPEAVPEFDESQAVSVSVISTKKRDFFSSIDKSVLDLVAKGSPDSLRAAYSQLHKSVESDYSEAEKTLHDVRDAMKINYFDDMELIAEQAEKYGK